MSLYSLLRAGLFSLDPETAHTTSIAAFRAGITPFCTPSIDPCLNVTVAGLNFKTPLGMAAGYDKNAEAAQALYKMGFGAVEVGTITPLPQSGNPKPRMFRLLEDEAVINRLGFNNEGLDAIKARIIADKPKYSGILGINIGANKDSLDRIQDYVLGAKAFLPLADYLTINISSPNTPGLRDLQGVAFLDDLLARVMDVHSEFNPPPLMGEGARRAGEGVRFTLPSAELQAFETENDSQDHFRGKAAVSHPIFLKIAPDMALEDIDDIIRISLKRGIHGLIVSNTTIARPDTLQSPNKTQAGGLSGKPLFAPSTAMLAQCYARVEGKLPLIGVGGIHSGATALQKIQAGASLIQLYSGLVYKGPDLVKEIYTTLSSYCKTNGFASISQATGTNHNDYL